LGILRVGFLGVEDGNRLAASVEASGDEEEAKKAIRREEIGENGFRRNGSIGVAATVLQLALAKATWILTWQQR